MCGALPLKGGAARQRATVGRTAGFSLVELMVAVAIIGILASIAYPTYRNYVIQSNRTDAVRVLSLDAQILQRCYSQYFSFNNAACTATLDTTSANGYYTVTGLPPAATTFTLTATPVVGSMQAADSACASFTIDQTGKQSALNSASIDSTTTCWGGN